MIVVNPATRQFNIPGADLVFGVTDDSGSEVKHFQCPRYVGNNLDIASCFVRMNYRNANGEIDSYLVQDLSVDGNNVLFNWELTKKVTMYKGNLSFVMCVVGPDTKVKWHTTLGRGQVLEGLEPDSAMIEQETADVVAQLLALVGRQTAAVADTGAEWVRNVQLEGTDQIVAVQTAGAESKAAAVAEIEAKRVNSLASIPADYTALSAAVDTIARTAAPGIVCSAEGEVITLNDASDNYLRGLRIFGKSTQNGTPTPENPVEIVSIENPVISVGEQTLSIPRTLHGIPVDAGGNYTDVSGQQWICDEIDFARGVFIKRVGIGILNGSEKWYLQEKNKYFYTIIEDRVKGSNLLCDSLVESEELTNSATVGWWAKAVDNYLFVVTGLRDAKIVNTIDELKTYLVDNPITVQYILEIQIETPLSETEIAAYRELHTNKPNTTILNDSGAYMSVDYTADTKLYIDNKLAALVGNT